MIYELICRLLTEYESIEVRDVCGKIAYRADAMTQSMADASVIVDEDAREIARFRRKVFLLHPVRQIEMLGGEVLTMKGALFHPFKDVISVEENGWKIRGNFTSHDYKVLDPDGEVLAEVTRPWASVRDRCRIDVKDERNADMLLALIIVLEHMLMDRRESVEEGDGAGVMAEGRGTVPGSAATADSSGSGR